MLRGAKPKPQTLKNLHGTARADRAKREPVAPDGAMVAPDIVAACPIASRNFADIIANAPRGILAPIDMPIVARLAIELSIGEIAIAALRSEGFMIKSGTGTMLPSPWLGAFHRSTEVARKLAAELGLVVTARARLDMRAPPPASADDDPDDPGMTFEEYLAMRPDRSLQ
jgi:phage terminase small subunit